MLKERERGESKERKVRGKEKGRTKGKKRKTLTIC